VINKKKIFVAGFWVMLIFGFSNLVRLGSNLIVTRLLEPEMFGVMAVVTIVTIGIAMFTDLGLWAFVVRHKDPNNPHLLNAVWTLQVLRGWMMFLFILIVTIILILGNQYVPSYFHGIYADSRLPLLIAIAGTGSVISGYTSMASPVMHRKIEIGKLEFAEFVAQLAGTLLMIVWVWLYPSIWALLVAGLVTGIARTFLSYYFFPFRHKLVWDKAIVKEVFHFSKWIVIASALTYLFLQGDKLFFAAKIDAAMLGVYSIAFMLVATLTSVTETLAQKIIFPVFSSIVHGDRSLLKQKYYKVRLYLDFPIFIIAGLLMALGPTIVNLLYDPRYSDAGWMLQILVISVIGNTLSVVSAECLSALSITKVRMWVMLIRTLGLFIGLPLFYSLYGFYGALWVIALNVWISLPIVYWTLAKNSVFSFFNEIRMLPVISVGYIMGKIFVAYL
jgi:O-antigen/teichoic acid export membrane protein